VFRFQEEASHRPGQLWGPRSLIFSGHCGLFPRSERPECEAKH